LHTNILHAHAVKYALKHVCTHASIQHAHAVKYALKHVCAHASIQHAHAVKCTLKHTYTQHARACTQLAHTRSIHTACTCSKVRTHTLIYTQPSARLAVDLFQKMDLDLDGKVGSEKMCSCAPMKIVTARTSL